MAKGESMKTLSVCCRALAAMAVWLAPATTLTAATPELANLPAVAPVMECASLAAVDISSAVGAKTSISAAAAVTDQKAAYCRVTGVVEPAVKFEVRLPLTTWTQRFVQTGCGGLCGNVSIRLGNADGCYPADHGELAMASTDMGHASGGPEGQFGEKDYQLRIDFAYRGVHVTTLAAKALIAAYYGRPAKYSYFSGCSDGGREALMAAQRYPADFNGITAGAPAMNFTTQNTFYHGWNALKNTGSQGKPILTADKLPLLHKAAVEACDAGDGLKDGLISDPLGCRFDPGTLVCKEGQDAATCLTAAQAQAARELYAGAHDGQGGKLVLGGPLPGSELGWQGVFVAGAAGGRTMSPSISTGTLKYLAYEKNPAADYALKDLQFTREAFTATTQLHGLYDATDPNLAAFAKAGGKLIVWHGMADPHISPLNSIAYYTAIERVLGAAAVKQFARLYLFPGGGHCGGGEGPFNFDLMSAIMAWVERGSAPDAIVAAHQQGGPRGPLAGVPDGPRGGPAAGLPAGGPPAAAVPPKADRTRPVFPYPVTAKYNGTGSIDDAASFSAGKENPVAPARLDWFGAGFYTPGYLRWCRGQGATMTCTSERGSEK